MKEQPQFEKLGLKASKTEVTSRRELDLLTEIAERARKDENYQMPQGYKLVEETQEFIGHRVPEYLPLSEAQKVVSELADELCHKALGFHFLEPICVSEVTYKVVPVIVSQRAVKPVAVKPSQNNSYSISMEQEKTKQRYELFK